MERNAPPTRSKSPKPNNQKKELSSLSTISNMSGNNNSISLNKNNNKINSSSEARPSSSSRRRGKSKSPAPNSNSSKGTSTTNIEPTNTSPSSKARPVMSPKEKSKLAREKFQSLLINASKVQEASLQSQLSQPTSTLAAAAQVHLAELMGATGNLTPGPSSPQGKNGNSQPLANKPSPSQQGISVNGNSNTVRATTLAASAKVSVAKNNPNQFPNIDPRNFPNLKPVPTTSNNFHKPSIYGSKSVMGLDRSRNLRAYVEKAIQEHKIFSCVGVYPAVKNALKKRGWVEKVGPINMIRSASVGPAYRPDLAGSDEESDQAWIARNLRDYPPDFIWVIRRDNIDWKSMTKDQMINRFPKAWFTTKVGLAACLQQMHWFSEAGFSETFFPRCYRLCLDDERQAFQEDYRLTACMSYLRHFVEAFDAKGASSLVDPQSRITPLSIDFASRQLGNYIRMRRHEDIDWLLPPNFMSQHWDAFVHQYYLVVHEKRRIRFESTEGVRMKYEMAKKTLQRIAQYWPQSHLDGVYNMWICKPGARSRGKGIVIMNSLDKILDLLNHGNSREANWVVQKYMERPLLVYKTKFDIRQWFIITDWSPLTVWFYKESYIRFCTKPFVLEDFHESIHLCNNAIQCRYQNAESRDSALPDENMWDCYTFQAYLKSIGKLDQWPMIYSGMKQAIIGVLLASQESVESRRGCFELYGADFMLSEDCNPWLIEINSCPCMAGTTSITARMCAQCLEDAVKVVIDRKHNKNADTGMFEMVYRQPQSAVTVQQFTGHDLVIHGKKLTRDIDWPGAISLKSTQSRKSALIVPVAGTLSKPSSTLPPPDNLTFSDLLQKLRMKNTQMFKGFASDDRVSGPEMSDRSLTAALLTRMKSLNKTQTSLTAQQATTNEIIPGMKKVYPSSSSSKPKNNREEPTGTLSHLSKYFEENSNTFANLVRIGKEISEENGNGGESDKENSNKRPETIAIPATNNAQKSFMMDSASFSRAETAKTLEEVRAAVNAASEKYGKNNEKSPDSTSPSATTSSSPRDTNNNHLQFYQISSISSGRDDTCDCIDTNNANKTNSLLLLIPSNDSGVQTSEKNDTEKVNESCSDADSKSEPAAKIADIIETKSETIQLPNSTLESNKPIVELSPFGSQENIAPTTNESNNPDPRSIVNNISEKEGNDNNNFDVRIRDVIIINNNDENLGFPSTSNSTSESNSDSDFETNFDDLVLFLPSTRSDLVSYKNPDVKKSVNKIPERNIQKVHVRRASVAGSSLQRCSTLSLQSAKPKIKLKTTKSKHLCHKMGLKPSQVSTSNNNRRKSVPIFPVTKINLKLL